MEELATSISDRQKSTPIYMAMTTSRPAPDVFTPVLDDLITNRVLFGFDNNISNIMFGMAGGFRRKMDIPGFGIYGKKFQTEYDQFRTPLAMNSN